jgi:hypothetical protein
MCCIAKFVLGIAIAIASVRRQGITEKRNTAV